MADSHSCAICRFMRSLVFSALGGGFAGYGALGLGMEPGDAIIAAFLGAVLAVVLVSRGKRRE
ncbi:MAG: hypothetical protein KDI27_04490 [Gammaproteobacteria bacterium]|nr:hypothetical protein [Gammaproteobacteria bacterium]MCP5416536.1 hypothetical protein [Chromatiaceae bacterium]